ncbi:sn-glycerol-3-phosphate ABC transporter ATP-binding protein UgpC [Aurantimonas aggregata]|uniref:sn-glycerol-3-phosphate ABC transporter ATP-binding protein UgpC n=1 Tax=Aurantimonas aggregata TaxID=2047720 RepID=A0A6L9MMQ8_9HYPH|nr:sn-glycerol-3-phosphate ABC transporter ATP-binding protein UgpC [Aurantimonas aggregata]NDV88995.1 sn-glycerol-3-phosphate ABC transporter ATP-binding protein UgpC [Aurantimonas aggregata]
MALIRMQQLVKKYGDLTVIPGLDLDIADHEFVVLVGPSGCGKSTLLRVLAGLEPIDGGELYIGDRKVNDVPAAQRDIAMVFQDYALYPHMTVRQNMAFALEMRGMGRSEIATRVEHAARLLDIGPYLDRRPKALSGGQRQRVAMGRAIVRDPQVFLFDEPLSNLDAKLRAQVRTEIKALSQTLRTTMVFVTHDQIEAMTMADRIVIMKSGVIQQVGTPEEVYETPANQFVASFIGSPSMNFMPVTRDGEQLVLADGKHLADTADLARRMPANGSAVLGVRPEHFLVVPEASAAISARIDLVEPLGSDTLIHLKIAGTDAIARVEPDLRPRPGDVVSLAPVPGKTHLFEASSGAVIL